MAAPQLKVAPPLPLLLLLSLSCCSCFAASAFSPEQHAPGPRAPTRAPPRRTPVLAWNAWNTFSQDGKPLRGGRAEYQSVVDAMVESGMVAAGYTLVSTVCTGWIGRDPASGELLQNLTAWPGGMASFAEYVHARGMQLSVYTDASTQNCCGEPGSAGYETQDMATFASWGVDAVGIDYCGGPQVEVRAAYQKFADGIAASGRAMQLGMWNLGYGRAWSWAPAMSRALAVAPGGGASGSFVPHIRVTSDIGNLWEGWQGPTMGVLTTVDVIQAIPDMWEYGMGNSSGTYPNYGQLVVGVPPDHPTRGNPGLSLVEAQSHFSMWCMFGSLLMATNDVRQRNASVEAILLNNETIAVNQDPWALPAFRINVASQPWRGDLGSDPRLPTQLQWARHLANGDVAALVLNRDDATTKTIPLVFADFLPGTAGGAYRVRDLQAQRDLGVACHNAQFTLAPHETAFVRLTQVNTSCAAPVADW